MQIHMRLKPFIVLTEEEENQTKIYVYIELPPLNVLLLRFRIKEGKTVVDFRSDTKDILNWIDSFFDKWDEHAND